MSRKNEKKEGISVLGFSDSSQTSEEMKEFDFDMSDTGEDENQEEKKVVENLKKEQDPSQESPPSSPESDIVDYSQYQFPIREEGEKSQQEQPQTQVLFATPEEEKEVHPAKKPKPESAEVVAGDKAASKNLK